MLERTVANRYIRAVNNGRTRPCRIEVIRERGDYTDVVAKFSGGCDRGVTSLAIEAICAMLAADLNLPIAEPLLVEIDEDFINLVPLKDMKNLLSGSNSIGFGSAHLPNGYAIWATGTKIPPALVADAVGVLAFDLLIQNIDRKPSNPNCLTNGKSIGIEEVKRILA